MTPAPSEEGDREAILECVPKVRPHGETPESLQSLGSRFKISSLPHELHALG